MIDSRKELKIYLGLLLVCVVSRLLTTIHYIEDPDSLRFALSVLDYDVRNLQPHFPGYPVFCFLAKLLYAAVGRFSYVFSIIGGLSIFLIIGSVVKTAELLSKNINPYILGILLFFNPLMWIMSNSFMPDVFGLGLCCLGFWLFTHAVIKNNNQSLFSFFLVVGLLAGARLSYIPFLVLPAGYLFFKYPKRLLQCFFAVFGVIIWLVPLIIDTGLNELFIAAQTQTEGHFSEWGGTISTEPIVATRLERSIRGLWADALGGWWIYRSWLSLIFSVFFLALVVAVFAKLVKVFNHKFSKGKFMTVGKTMVVLYLLIGSLVLYSLWIYFFQNVVHKPRHILPLVPFLLFLPAFGYSVVSNWSRNVGFAILSILILLNVAMSFQLLRQHKKPTAISQVVRDLARGNQNARIIVSLELVNFFLRSQGVNAEFLSIENDADRIKALNSCDENFIMVGDFTKFLECKPTDVNVYYHNPYVNRMWHTVPVYKY